MIKETKVVLFNNKVSQVQNFSNFCLLLLNYSTAKRYVGAHTKLDTHTYVRRILVDANKLRQFCANAMKTYIPEF
jgi:hypothetical protein